LRLISTSSAAAIVPFGVSSPAFVQGGGYHAHGSGTPAEGLYADAAVLTPSATLATGSGAPGAPIKVQWTLLAADGALIGRGRAVLNGAHGVCQAPDGTILLAEMNPRRLSRLVPVD
jgi:hypothetical protein